MSARLPAPSLTRVYRLEATLGEPLDLGDLAQGRRRIVPLTGGTFTGPELNGKLLPGSSADWQTVLPDGTALGDIRYTLETDEGDLPGRGLDRLPPTVASEVLVAARLDFIGPDMDQLGGRVSAPMPQPGDRNAT
jgi:hypothetical protein